MPSGVAEFPLHLLCILPGRGNPPHILTITPPEVMKSHRLGGISMIKLKPNHWLTIGLAAFAVISSIIFILLPWAEMNNYQAVNNSTMNYYKAQVDQVVSETLSADNLEPGRNLGTQEILVTLQEGPNAGQQVEILNYLNRTQNVEVRAGQTVIVCADEPDGVEAYYTVYSYYRNPAILSILLFFGALIILVGRGTGAKSLLGLAYTIFAVLFFLLQAIFHGLPSVPITLLTVTVTTVVSLLLMGGASKKSLAAILSTVAGLLLSTGVFAVFQGLLHISGYTMDEAESLLLVTQATGLDLGNLLLVSVLISSLGAVMDMSMSVASPLEEIHRLNPEHGFSQLVRSGMNIGRDTIGTMTNTLIMAFTGTALTTMLVLMGYGWSFQQLLNSNYLAMELAQSIASTTGVVLTVPVTSLIGAWMFTKWNWKGEKAPQKALSKGGKRKKRA